MSDIERIADDLVQFIFDRDCKIDISWIPVTYYTKHYYISLKTDVKGHWLWRMLTISDLSNTSKYLKYRATMDINNIAEFSSKEIKIVQKYWIAYIEICDYINSLKIPKVLLQNGFLIDALKKAYKVRLKRFIV